VVSGSRETYGGRKRSLKEGNLPATAYHGNGTR
jgi:hypothetical protein